MSANPSAPRVVIGNPAPTPPTHEQKATVEEGTTAYLTITHSEINDVKIENSTIEGINLVHCTLKNVNLHGCVIGPNVVKAGLFVMSRDSSRREGEGN